MITAQTSPEAATATPTGAPALEASLAAAIDAQARRVDQLSAAILRATAQVTWSGRAADRFRARASERARECLQLAVALRASAERVHAAANAQAVGGGHVIAAGNAAGGGSNTYGGAEARSGVGVSASAGTGGHGGIGAGAGAGTGGQGGGANVGAGVGAGTSGHSPAAHGAAEATLERAR